MPSNVKLAPMLSALGHPRRLAIFQLVMRQGLEGIPAGTIARELGISATNLSFHLKELRLAGWVAAERRGQQIFYRACYDKVQMFLESFQQHCCADAPTGCAPVCGGSDMSLQVSQTEKEEL